MTDIISVEKILAGGRGAFRRFPVTVILLIGAVIWGVLAIHEVFGEATTISTGYFLGRSCTLAAVMSYEWMTPPVPQTAWSLYP